MNARIAKKVYGSSRWRRYSDRQHACASAKMKRVWRREDLSRALDQYYESPVGTPDGKLEVYHVRVCTVCRHLECPCCLDWCDDLNCLDRNHHRCTFVLPRKSEPIRVEGEEEMNCERCGSPGAITALTTWEDPPIEQTLCSLCADVLCNKYIEKHPPPAELSCIGCDAICQRVDMKTFANKRGGAFLCPRCYERAESTGRLPWEPAPASESN